MTQQHPITPPLELVLQWADKFYSAPIAQGDALIDLATRAAQWGANEELEACRMEIIDGAGLFYIDETSDRVRLAEDIWTARRPKPPSLKRQALIHLESFAATFETSGGNSDLIRRALEQLPDQENS
jgi:hypothetical protein